VSVDEPLLAGGPGPDETIRAIREWVDSGIERTLAEDLSGFLLGIQSVTILTALDELSDRLSQLVGERDQLREALERIADGAISNPPSEIADLARAALAAVSSDGTAKVAS
jgi:hypothetical protein